MFLPVICERNIENLTNQALFVFLIYTQSGTLFPCPVIPLPSLVLGGSRKGFVGLCTVTLSSVHLFVQLLPDREPAPDCFLVQGVCFSPLLHLCEGGVWALGFAAVSVCPPVAGCCTDTSTGGWQELRTAASTTTTLHWVEALRISDSGRSAVWVSASRVLLAVFWHAHSSDLGVWARAGGVASWSVSVPVCWLLLPEDLTWNTTVSLASWLSLKFSRGPGLVGLCFGFPCEPMNVFRVSAQKGWSKFEAVAWSDWQPSSC